MSTATADRPNKHSSIEEIFSIIYGFRQGDIFDMVRSDSVHIKGIFVNSIEEEGSHVMYYYNLRSVVNQHFMLVLADKKIKRKSCRVSAIKFNSISHLHLI